MKLQICLRADNYGIACKAIPEIQQGMLLVTIEDATEADRTFDMLMGAAVDPRRRFIITHAAGVRNLDV